MKQAIIVFGDDDEVVKTMINASTDEITARIQAKIDKFLNPSETEPKED